MSHENQKDEQPPRNASEPPKPAGIGVGALGQSFTLAAGPVNPDAPRAEDTKANN